MPYASIVLHAIILSVFLALYWKAGQIESPYSNSLSYLWCCLSLLCFALAWYLEWGLVGFVLGQIVLGIGIGVARAVPMFLHSGGKRS